MQTYQPPIDTLELLSPPTLDDVQQCAWLAKRALVLHAGRVAEAAGNITGCHPPDEQGTWLCSAKLTDATGTPIDCAIISFFMDDEVGTHLLGDAGLDWGETFDTIDQDLEDEVPIELAKCAAIVIDFNRRWSAYDWMRQCRPAFLDLMETIAHEVGHLKDRKNTVKLNTYDKVKGKLSDHRYMFDPTEMRARVFSALVMYSHMYLHASAASEKLPDRESPDSEWWDLMERSGMKDLPMDEFNDDNQSLIVSMVKDVACSVLEEYESAKNRRLPVTADLFLDGAALKAIKPGRVPRDAQQRQQMEDAAARALADFAFFEWDKNEEG